MSTGVNRIAAHLGAFRPSDRVALDGYLKDRTTRSETLAAIKDFVRRWEEADWLEAYSIERIGKWIAKSQMPEMSDELGHWCKARPSEARVALLSGLQQGLDERQAALA